MDSLEAQEDLIDSDSDVNTLDSKSDAALGGSRLSSSSIAVQRCMSYDSTA
jgi:hypothetical protein